ncbi:conserved hypothetical protein [Streptomyces lividans TK24]|nr:conserved hypothetical protein [Streptomyces lividans TK24]
MTAPLSDSRPRCPSCVCSGLEPPLPNLPARASAADAFTEVPLTDFAAGYCTAVAAPDHCGPPGPVVSPVAVLHHPGFDTPPPHRPATAGTAARQFVSAGPCGPSGLQEKHNHTAAQCLLQPMQISMCPAER